MKSKKDLELELNQVNTSLAVFMESYNQSVPTQFAQATVATLTEFKNTYPLLFKNGNEWSIDKHRKKFMDWQLSQRQLT